MKFVHKDDAAAGWIVALMMLGVIIGYSGRGVTEKKVHGQNVTVTGYMPGVMFYYDSSGVPMVATSCTVLSGTTSGGTFSLSGTAPTYQGAAQWTNPSGAWIQSIRVTSAGTAIGQAYTAYPVTLTASSSAVSLTGTVLSPTTLVVLGGTAVNASTNKTITADVCAN